MAPAPTRNQSFVTDSGPTLKVAICGAAPTLEIALPTPALPLDHHFRYCPTSTVLGKTTSGVNPVLIVISCGISAAPKGTIYRHMQFLTIFMQLFTTLDS